MVRTSGLGVSRVHRLWKAHGLKPHRVETFKVSRDKHFVETPKRLDIHPIIDNTAAHKHAEITKNRIRRGAFKNVKDPRSAISSYLEQQNENPTAFVWTASPAAILGKVARAKQGLESVH